MRSGKTRTEKRTPDGALFLLLSKGENLANGIELINEEPNKITYNRV